MHYKVLFRIEKKELLNKLKAKISNLQSYMDSEGHTLEIEIVCLGDIVEHFKDDYSDLVSDKWDVALCANSLRGSNMEPINNKNVRTVKAGIGEIIEKKAAGWIEFTIE